MHSYFGDKFINWHTDEVPGLQDTDKLNLIAAVLVSGEHHEVFGKFFHVEANIYTSEATSESAQRTASEDTPLRSLAAAMKASVTSTPAWTARKIVTSPLS